MLLQLDYTFDRDDQEGDIQLEWGRKKDFQKMKEIMRRCPVLSFLDFTKPFVLECGASGEGIVVIFIQEMHPISYESRKL